MKDRNFKKDFIAVFITINYALSILLSVFIAFTGGHESKFISLGYFSMLIPAIAVIIMTNAFKVPVNKFDWHRFPVKWIIPALLLMPVVIHLACLLLLSFLNKGNLPWQTWLYAGNDGLYHSPADKGWGTLNRSELVIKVIINAITGVIIISILAFFEEIGWRAWMLPRLVKKFNVKKGIIIGSLVWALWHIPFIISGISYVDNVPLFSTLLVPIGTFGAGIIINWLWLKTKSIWIVSLAHGSLNNWGQYAFKYMQDLKSSDTVMLLIGVEASLVITALIILCTMKNDYCNGVMNYSNKHLTHQ